MTQSAMAASRSDLDATMKLEADLGIEKVKALHAQLADAFDDEGEVRLEASEVERVHTAALQLFVLFCRDMRAAGREVSFLKPSEALRSAAALLGATTLLNLAKVSHESGQ